MRRILNQLVQYLQVLKRRGHFRKAAPESVANMTRECLAFQP